jgi:Arc/MetJ-type ribon-helix-helix transcriptional regulator
MFALVGRGDFGSMSDLVGIALAEFIGKYEKNKSEKCSNKELQNSPGVVIHNLE